MGALTLPVYLDSSVVIVAFEQSGDLAHRLRSMFFAAEQSGRMLMTSELTFAECIVRPLRENLDRLIIRYEALLFGQNVIKTHPIEWTVLHVAGLLRATNSSVRLPDAIHLATALIHGCSVFLTGDKRLAARYELFHHFRHASPSWTVGPAAIDVIDVRAADQSPFNSLLEPEYRR